MITIEEINGQKMTVIWHRGVSGHTFEDHYRYTCGGVIMSFSDGLCMQHIATALPALPRHPQPEDVRLLYRYMAEGLIPYGMNSQGDYAEHDQHPVEFVEGCNSETGEKVEVAIDG